MIKINILAISVIFLSNISLAYSSDEAIAMCNDCHGKNGVSTNSDVPTIAGYSEVSILDAMAAYIDETRPAKSMKFKHGDTSRPETDMITIAKEVEDDLDAIAAYYAEQTFVPAKQDFDAAQAKKGAEIHEKKCDSCHYEGGSVADDDAGRLAGQWMPYLKQSFDDYRSGSREADKKMIRKVKKFSDEEISYLLHYYASLQ